MDLILKYPDPALTTPTREFNFREPPGDPQELATLLMQVMNDNNAVGLAANQLGIPYSVFVLRGYPHNFVCFNPKVVFYSPEEEEENEGCLSFPGVNVKVKRSKEIRVRFQTPSGEMVTHSFSGLTARAFQHEIDHLDGKIFVNRANRVHRDREMRKYYNGRKLR